MIILFEDFETQFTSLGLGVLSDAIEPLVNTTYDGTFTFTMKYPITGKKYKEIRVGRIVYCKANPFDEAQPFRIWSITRPINGIVTVDAYHISYDMNGIPVKPLDGKNLNEVLAQIQNETFDEEGNHVKYTIVDHKFIFSTNVTNTRTYKTTAPFNMRAILLGSDDSILSKYDAEIKFDKYRVYILQRLGANKGAKITYGHNMVDINHKTSDENLYTAVFPFYHSEKKSMETNSEDSFKKVYIVGSKPFQDGWLSYSKDGQPYHPVDEAPVQIDTEGEFYQKVYTWNTLYQCYEERVYNETVTLIQGVIEPTWISIDWSHFPAIICRAAAAGYFKKSTDTTWGDLKAVGDVIFEGSILNSGIIENLIIAYAEVIPTSGNKENVEVTEIIDVQLDGLTIPIETQDAKALTYDKILTLDLSSEFDEEPSKERLEAKAEEYIVKNKIGQLKHSTTVSFVDLRKTREEGVIYEHFDEIALGDTVRVIYEDLGVDVELRVKSTTYNPNTDEYTKVELGEIEKKLTDSTVQTGDNVSALTNDLGYATTQQVQKIIAETITAEFIQATNAQLSEAQIKQLQVERIECSGILEAIQFKLDKLIAKMLVAEDAEIKNTLTAGNIKVAGDIDVKSGTINIQDDEGNKFFNVDREGNLTANSVSITGGGIDINGFFTVDPDGTMMAANATIIGAIYATEGEIGGCEIRNGVLKIEQANIEGDIQANKMLVQRQRTVDETVVYDVIFSANADTCMVEMAGFTVEKLENIGYIKAGTIEHYGDDTTGHTGVYIGTDGIQLGTKFMVDPDGIVNAEAINIGGTLGQPNMYVANDGIIHAKDIDLTGGAIKIGGYTQDPTFSVNNDGEVIAKKMKITGGKISGDSTTTIEFPNFSLDTQGNMIARNAVINGEINATSGKIGCAVSYKIDTTKLKDWHNISNFIILTPDIYGNDASWMNFALYTWINFGGSMPTIINHNADYTKILVRIDCYTGNPSYGPIAYPPNPPTAGDYVHPNQLTLYLILQINPDTGEIVYNTYTPQMTYNDTMPHKNDVNMNFDKVGTCAYIGCNFVGNWTITKIITQYEISKYFLKDYVKSYISSGLYIASNTLYAEKITSGVPKNLIEINYGNTPEIIVRNRNNSNSVTISGDDVSIRGTNVKDKLTSIENKANRVWGARTNPPGTSYDFTLSFIGCPFSSSDNIAFNLTFVKKTSEPISDDDIWYVTGYSISNGTLYISVHVIDRNYGDDTNEWHVMVYKTS